MTTTTPTTARIRPFRVEIPQSDVDDLADRLARTRLPHPAPGDDWAYGVPNSYLRTTVEAWRTAFDWRQQEERINAFPHHLTEIDGQTIHFLHVPSPVPGATPLLLVHSYPGSFVDFLDMIGPLTDPAAHGGRPEDAFSVVVPSLPGFAWSGKPATPGWGLSRTADAWAELMSRLGYPRFGAQGGDIGSFVSANLGARHPDRVAGIHLNMVVTGPPEGQTEFTERELRALDRERRFRAEGAAYNQQQRTRPQTLGYGLTDSPVGQCAWILEKFQAWADCAGDPVAALGADRILDHVSTYWFTATATSSARMYWEMAHAPEERAPQVSVPTGVSVFPHEIFQPPREWAQRQFPDLRLWREHDRGGHFAATEQPGLLVDDVREFFRPLR
jgi:epoxide hydrolase